jgi:hypothetical protein
LFVKVGKFLNNIKDCDPMCPECSGPTSNDCTGCGNNTIVHRTLSGTTCLCDDKYYDPLNATY